MTRLTHTRFAAAAAAVLLAGLGLANPGPSAARVAAGSVSQTILGTAQDFAVLGATTVTNTGFSILDGDLGLQPGTSVTGFPPGIVNGTVHVSDAVALQAQSDALTAYNSLAGWPATRL